MAAVAARITLGYQILPDDAQVRGTTEDLRYLLANLRDRYEADFMSAVVRASNTDPHINGVEVVIKGIDALNYRPGIPLIRVEFFAPPQASGKTHELLVKHTTFLSRWLEHTASGIGNGDMLYYDGEAIIPIDMSFGTIHPGAVIIRK